MFKYFKRAWNLAWSAFQAYRLYEFLRDQFDDLM